jgi:hypothetical protein
MLPPDRSGAREENRKDQGRESSRSMDSRTRRGSGDAVAFCPRLEGGHEALGQAHGEAGGLGPGLPVDFAELGDVEGGEVPVEEGSMGRGGTVFIGRPREWCA